MTMMEIVAQIGWISLILLRTWTPRNIDVHLSKYSQICYIFPQKWIHRNWMPDHNFIDILRAALH
jgi:hypothetical protein